VNSRERFQACCQRKTLDRAPIDYLAHLLPQGSPEEVGDAVRAALKLFHGRGNYILAPSQILGTDIPLENVLAMYRAAAVAPPCSANSTGV